MDCKKLIALILILGVSCISAQQKDNWLDREYGYFAQNESLRSLLYDFAASISIPAIISSRIDASISGNFPLMRAQEFLANISKAYQLAWVFDGTTLYAYDLSEIKSETIELSFAKSQKFQEYFKELNIEGTPLDWKFIPTQNIIQVSGPPRFVKLVRDIANRVRGEADTGTPQQARAAGAGYQDEGGYVVRVFYIKYGYVDSGINSTTEGKQPVVNLAAMIGKIMNVAHITGIEQSPDRRVKKLLGTGLVPSQAQTPAAATPPAAAPSRTGERKKEAYIIGDPRLNAIVVRDRSARMPVYESLIQELDRPLDQIEIEVTVLDVDSSEVLNLGLDFESRNVYFAARRRTAPADPLSGNTFAYRTTLSPADFKGLLVRINALQADNKSRILSRPSVLTLDNHEAKFENSQTFYVRLGVAGTDPGNAVDLVPVTYGANLKVRPHVIYEGGERKIQLAVHVEDGSRSTDPGMAVTGVPSVSQNIIQTQAVINEGQSLLIGGYIIREVIVKDERVPILGYIPIVGLAFSNKANTQTQVSRYFAITPRIVDTSIHYKLKTGFEDIDNAKEIEILQDAATGKKTRLISVPQNHTAGNGPP